MKTMNAEELLAMGQRLNGYASHLADRVRANIDLAQQLEDASYGLPEDKGMANRFKAAGLRREAHLQAHRGYDIARLAQTVFETVSQPVGNPMTFLDETGVVTNFYGVPFEPIGELLRKDET